MDRRKAVVAAATMAGSLLAASTAYALTSGVIGGGPDDGAGDLSPIVETPAAPDTTTTPRPASGEDDLGTAVQVTGDRPAGSSDDDAFEDEDVDHDGNEAGEPFGHEGRDDDD